MSKNAKMLLGLTGIALLAVVYFALSTRPVTLEPEANQGQTARENKMVPVDLAKLEETYKTETKMIVTEFGTVAQAADPAAATSSAPADDLSGRVSALRERLMRVTVPAQYRELHLELVLAFGRMEEYFLSRRSDDRSKSLESIAQAKAMNDWLN